MKQLQEKKYFCEKNPTPVPNNLIKATGFFNLKGYKISDSD